LPALDKARAMAYEEAERMMRFVDDFEAQEDAKR
jgi:hypothetical protein